ncbi:MAG: hypothetical protein H8E57_01970, partial [Candidatus Cloacimonetes bacterium]|nr:hypothetical protein [Candidatus Cloacimonadota bacterium]
MGRKLVFLVIVLININLFANWVAVEENSTKKMFEVSSSNPGSTEFDFSLKGYEQETIIENGISYERISFENEGQFLNVGKPDLPRFTKLIAIENEGEISVVVNDLNEEIITGITVYPRQNLKKDNEEYDRSFMIDNDYYSSGDVYPAKIVEAGEPAIMRDLRIVSVPINPFRFDPQNKELRIIKNISVTVNCSGRNGENIKLKNSSKSRFFEPLYKASILNYEHIASREEVFQDPSYLFIYPSIMTGNANLQALLDWKHQKGFVVNAASTTETGTSNTEIKSYIQNAYDNWSNPPEFICLVGDAGGTFDIPTWFISGGEGDHPYTQLEGGDILADAYIGRLSFNSYTEFDAIVYKILYYEKEPYITETDWYEQAQLVGDPASSDQSTITTCKTVKEIISAHSDGYSFDEIYFGDYDGSMMTSYNDGVGYSCYRGYLGMSGWGTDDIDNMTNDHKLPFALHLTCGTGDFEGTSDSRSERFLKVGTWNAPKGAIGAIGTATMGTHTTFNNCVTAGTFYGVFTDEIFNMGGALVRGKLHLYNSYPDNPSNFVDIFSYWDNLMGDPGLELWTGVPQPLTVIYDTDIPLGSNVIEVTVETSTRAAIEGAWVTALLGDDEIFSTGYTDSAGKVYLPIDADTEDTVTLTVTKHNYIPHLGSFDISQETSFVNVYETTIDDDNSGTSSGNNDGLINPGEDIELEVSLINDGTGTAYSVAALISSASSIISITDNTETYGTITAGNSTYSADDFDFSVAADALGGTEIILDVAVTEGLSNEWNDKIYLTVSGPNLDYVSYTVSDGGNGILDPSETSDLIVTIENIGSETAGSVYGILSCSNSLITVSDDQGYFGSITSGSQ